MARRSPPLVNQKCETGCTWRMFGIFNLRDGHSDRRLVSNRRHLNTHATGNGNSRRSSNVPSTIDEKYPHIGVSSRRSRDYSWKSISCMENDQVADWGNEVTKMLVDQRFFNESYQGKDGEGYQPDQFLDALQILYSNKELFLKLLQDPNSLLVKQIHHLQSSQVKEPYLARQKRMTRLKKYQNINSRQCGKPLITFDRYDSSSSCEPSKRIIVLKPGNASVKNFADTSLGYPKQNIKSSHFPFGRIKRKLTHVMRVRRKEQQWRTTDGVPCKFPCSSQGMEDGKKEKELEIARRNSPINVHASSGRRLNSYLDLKKRDKIIKLKDSELCMGQEAASFGESCSKNTKNTLVNPSEQNMLNIHVEGGKGPSQMLNCGIEECKQCTNSLERTIPLPDSLSLPSVWRHCEHGSDTERMTYHNNHQMVHRTKLGLHKDGENGSYSSSGQKIKVSPPVTTIKTLGDELELVGADISIRKSLPGDNFDAHYDILRDGGYKDSPTQNFDINNATGGLESFPDSHPEIQTLSFSPDIASSNPSSCQRIEDTTNIRNRIDHPSTEPVVTNPPILILQPDESPVQVMHDKFEENHFSNLLRSSLDSINNLTSSKNILNCIREIFQALNLKWDELTMKNDSWDLLLDPFTTIDELKGSTCQLCDTTILHDCVIETFIEVYMNCGFPPHLSSKNANVQACVGKKVLLKEITELFNWHFFPHPSSLTLQQLVEKDIARCASWLNIQVDAEDIAIEVAKDVLGKLVLEIVSEMDIKEIRHCKLQ